LLEEMSFSLLYWNHAVSCIDHAIAGMYCQD
jgi:hypothetical protein